jgi:hypothetical protein
MKNANNSTKKCDAFCKGFVKRMKEKVTGIRAKLANALPVKQRKTFLKTVSAGDGSLEEKLRKECEKGYCNTDCKDTIFQDGKDVPASVLKAFTGPKEARNLFTSMIRSTRKKVFGKKTSVLKNSFYTGLSAKDVKRIKAEGATSGCTLIAM